LAQQPRRSLQLFQAIEKDASGFADGVADFAMFHVEQWGLAAGSCEWRAIRCEL
jgi:hypothetical protein